MNSVNLIGRLTRDPEVRYTNDELAIASFTLAVDRPTKNKEADFPRIKVFGKQAENVGKYVHKGSQIGIHGRIQTGKYEDSSGNTVFTVDVIADRVEFLSKTTQDDSQSGFDDDGAIRHSDRKDPQNVPMGFEDIDDEDIPF